DSRHYIYDFAAARRGDASLLIEKLKYLAARDGIPAGIFCNREHPLREVLLEEGFTYGRHTRHLLALILRPERIFAKLAKNSFLLRELQLKAVTPHREMFLNNPKRPKASATIFLKETYFSRLMFRRLDLNSALEMDLIRMTPLPKRMEQALGRVFTFAPWAQFDMDYA
ncbi:MAG: hypothetical protein JXA52_00500, partial [Planctomycetes bacterium]|nr:hypothetical protein [Planctomycetota bacterium]